MAPERREHAGSRPCPSSSHPGVPGKHEAGLGRAAPRTPSKARGTPALAWQEAGCAAHRVATVPELPAAPRRPRPPSTKAGRVNPSPRSPPGAPQNMGPPGQGGARAGKMSLERVCAAVCETHRDPFLPRHQIRTPESSARCSGPPAPTAGLDRASRSGWELGEELGKEGRMEGGREEITAQL